MHRHYPCVLKAVGPEQGLESQTIITMLHLLQEGPLFPIEFENQVEQTYLGFATKDFYERHEFSTHMIQDEFNLHHDVTILENASPKNLLGESILILA